MGDILMTNIFFMITALSSVVLTLMLSILLIYTIRFIKKINRITDAVSDETVKILHDVEEVRESVKKHIQIAKGVASAAFIKKTIESIFSKK